jgi:seryl-tRNA synthetase
LDYEAERDGLLWFSLQIVFMDGTKEPPDIEKHSPDRKVYVNSEHKALKVDKSYDELQRKVVELQKTVEELKRRLAESESRGKGK